MNRVVVIVTLVFVASVVADYVDEEHDAVVIEGKCRFALLHWDDSRIRRHLNVVLKSTQAFWRFLSQYRFSDV